MKKLCTQFSLLLIFTWISKSSAQTTIASDGFESSSVFTITNGNYYCNNSAAGDRPATSPFHTGGTCGYGCNNETVTLISPSYNTTCYSSVSVSLRVAAFSYGSTSNGPDAADNVAIYISIDGGANFTEYLQVNGNNDCYWSFTGGTGTATTAYPTMTTFAPGGGGNRTADGYSTLTVTNLPAAANLAVKIIAACNSASELWVIDDFKLQGTASTCVSITPTTISPTNFTVSCAAGQSGTVTFTSVATFSGTNDFTAYLSDQFGNFATPLTLGTLNNSSSNSGTINITIPVGVGSGTGYQIKIVSNSPTIVSDYSSTFTITSSCAVCPKFTGAVINGCDNGSTPCDEGQTEIMFFNSGGYSITRATLPTNVINYYGSAAHFSSNSPDSYTGTFSTHAATTTALNALSGCSGAFVEAATVPAGATFIMLPYDFCVTNYNLSAICAALSPIYVLYYGTSSAGNGDGSWSTGGNLGNYNSGANPKYITADFTTVNSGCKEYYNYDAGQEFTGNGAGASYPGYVSTNSLSPTNPYSYTTSGCTLPLVLPVQLLDFAASKTSENVLLKWTTNSETNSDYFDAEYSLDAKTFVPFTQVKAAGNSQTKKEYTCFFNENIGDNTPYFRLKQVDFNKNYNYSNIITFSNNKSTLNTSSLIAYYNTENDKIVSKFKLEYPQQVNVSLYNLAGQEVFVNNSFYNEGDNQLLMDAPDKEGIYFLVFQNGSGSPIHKKIMVSK